MPASLQNPADVVNAALVRIGHSGSIGNLYEGSDAAIRALQIYSQTRDELLREGDWGFAERSMLLTLLKSAPAGGYIPGVTPWDPALYPPLSWLFSYSYPADCMKIRAIKGTPLFVPNFDPQPNVFNVANDTTTIPFGKIILCNVADAVMVYTGQVTNPLTWEPDFAEALIASLARRLSISLAPSPEIAKLEATDEVATIAQAEMKQG